MKIRVRGSLTPISSNVCRVYDIGEVNGAPFFTMEYVDGEDLGSLLRRTAAGRQSR